MNNLCKFFVLQLLFLMDGSGWFWVILGDSGSFPCRIYLHFKHEEL